MLWGFHVSAVSLALTFGDNETARELLEGLAARMDKLKDHPLAGDYLEWYPDLSALLVVAAANGLPLTDREAQLVIEHYTKAAAYHEDFAYWDLWSLPDGEYAYLPDRYLYDEFGNPIEKFYPHHRNRASVRVLLFAAERPGGRAIYRLRRAAGPALSKAALRAIGSHADGHGRSALHQKKPTLPGNELSAPLPHPAGQGNTAPAGEPTPLRSLCFSPSP
jgi:hypothetical protein